MAALLCVVPMSAWSACEQAQWAGHAGAERSRWIEEGSSGARLLVEEGQLSALGLGATLPCGRWQWSAALSQAWGTRRYDGISTVGAPVQTRSEIQQRDLRWGLERNISERLVLAARVGHRRIEREIASVDGVLGYPERFSYWQVAAGGAVTPQVWGPFAVSAGAWWGGGPRGRMVLQLPGVDPTSLTLGRSRMHEFTASLQTATADPIRPRWRVQAGVRRDVISAGPPSVVRRGGLPVGGAAQPRTHIDSAWLLVTWPLDF